MLKRETTAAVFLLLILAVAAFKEPRFFQSSSVESILLWMPLLLVVAMGQLLVILTGGIDLSVGSVIGFAGIGVGLMFKANPNLPVPVALLAGLAIGGILGLINAALIVGGKISPLIVTIGTLATFRGLTFLLSDSRQIDSSMIPDSMTSLANTGLPFGAVNFSWLLLIAVLVTALTGTFLMLTSAGRNIFAFGSHAEAARLRGIPVARTQTLVYALCGALAGLAGVLYAARFGFVNPRTAGEGFELSVIAAVAIGGAKLTGGSGSVPGVVLGCLLLSCINVGLSLLGIDANWQMLTYGAVILVGILADGLMRRERAR